VAETKYDFDDVILSSRTTIIASASVLLILNFTDYLPSIYYLLLSISSVYLIWGIIERYRSKNLDKKFIRIHKLIYFISALSGMLIIFFLKEYVDYESIKDLGIRKIIFGIFFILIHHLPFFYLLKISKKMGLNK